MKQFLKSLKCIFIINIAFLKENVVSTPQYLWNLHPAKSFANHELACCNKYCGSTEVCLLWFLL